MTPGQATNLDTHGKLGCYLELLEKLESCILPELKAVHEGTWKMGEFTVFSWHLVMQVILELRTLLKVVLKAYPELQDVLIDVQQYKPMRFVGGTSAAPEDLDFISCTMGKCEDRPDDLVDLKAMHCAYSALGKVSLPPKACFVLGKVVHMQFDGCSYEWHTMGRFMILDTDRVEIICAG